MHLPGWKVGKGVTLWLGATILLLIAVTFLLENGGREFFLLQYRPWYDDIDNMPSVLWTSDDCGKLCDPVTRFAFAKTHKTGGSTLQSILMRYGYLRNLTFALPRKSWMFSFDEPFKADMVSQFYKNPNKTFDIFTFHSIWNSAEVDKVIPKPSKKITLLRDPVDLFESGYVYMGLEKNLGMDINQYAEKIVSKRHPTRRFRSWFDKNEMLWDLGMDVSAMESDKDLRETIQKLETEFDLVLIAERFDESLIVLKEEMCWTLEDVKYLTMNEREKKYKNTTILPETRLILQQWMKGDYQLYDYFNHKLTEAVKRIGHMKVNSDVGKLKDMNERLKQGCQAHFVDNNSIRGSPMHMAHHMVKAYGVKENCTIFAIAEPAFYNLVRKKQLAKLGSLTNPPPKKRPAIKLGK